VGYFCGGSDLFKYLQQQTYPPYNELPLAEKMKVAAFLETCLPNSGELKRMALSSGKFDRRMVDYTDEYGRTALHLVTRDFAQYCCWFVENLDLVTTYNNSNKNNQYYEDINDPNSHWCRLIKDLVTAGASVHAIDNARRSILCHVILAIYCSPSIKTPRKFLAAAFQILGLWLADLKEVGVDLARYGAKEKALHLTGKVGKTFDYYRSLYSWYKPLDNLPKTLIGFSFGYCPEDWYFWFPEPTDVFAGDFWAIVEAPTCQYDIELSIPGSWIE
jgi:hypothetical protein